MNLSPELHANRCTRYRFRYSECTRCKDACPHDAIGLSDEGVTIAQERCKGCGLCVAACRTETFEMAGLAAAALVRKASGSSAFTIACEPSRAAADAVVPCLGAMSPAMVACIARQGADVRLCGSEHCADCVHAPRGGESLDRMLDAVLALCADGPVEGGSIRLTPSSTPRRSRAADAGASRRAFFRRIAAAAATPTAAETAVPLRAIRAARPFASAQRELLQQLSLAGSAAALAAHPGLAAGEVRLHPGCTGCEACARACPTAALQVMEDEARWALAFDGTKCVGCEVCREACQPGVLELAAAIPAASFGERKPVALTVRRKQRCSRCDRVFVATAPEATLCEVCAGDDQDFESLFG